MDIQVLAKEAATAGKKLLETRKKQIRKRKRTRTDNDGNGKKKHLASYSNDDMFDTDDPAKPYSPSMPYKKHNMFHLSSYNESD